MIPLWECPGYLEDRRAHRAAVCDWWEHSVSLGFINLSGDIATGGGLDFEACWDDNALVHAEHARLEEWALSEALRRGMDPERIYEDAPCDLAIAIQDALNEDRDPDPVVELHMTQRFALPN